MKRLLIWIAGIMAVAVAGDLLLGVAMERAFSRGNLPADYRSIDYVLTRSDDSVLVLGSSVALYSVDTHALADSLGTTAYNGGAIGQNFPFYLTMLKAVVARPVKPHTVLLGISSTNLGDRGAGTRYNILARYYGRHMADIDSVFTGDKQWRRLCMYSNAYAYNINWVRILMTQFSNRAVEGANGFLGMPVPAVFPSRQSFEALCEFKPERRAQLAEFAAICRDNGIRLIVFLAPSLAERRIDAVTDTVRAMGHRLGFTVWDDTYLPPFDTDSTLYYDAGHLNINGARLYTDTVIARLRAPGKRRRGVR